MDNTKYMKASVTYLLGIIKEKQPESEITIKDTENEVYYKGATQDINLEDVASKMLDGDEEYTITVKGENKTSKFYLILVNAPEEIIHDYSDNDEAEEIFNAFNDTIDKYLDNLDQ